MALSLLEKKQRRSAILGQLKLLRDAAKETNRSLLPEEQTKFDGLLTEDGTLKAEILADEANDTRLSAIGNLEKELAVVGGLVTQPDSLGGNGVHIEVKKPEGLDRKST